MFNVENKLCIHLLIILTV